MKHEKGSGKGFLFLYKKEKTIAFVKNLCYYEK